MNMVMEAKIAKFLDPGGRHGFPHSFTIYDAYLSCNSWGIRDPTLSLFYDNRAFIT
jgi:hypothetical protein